MKAKDKYGNVWKIKANELSPWKYEAVLSHKNCNKGETDKTCSHRMPSGGEIEAF